MKRLLALLLALAALVAAPGPAPAGQARAAQTGPTLFDPAATPPTPPRALLAAQPSGAPTLAQTSALRCDQLLADTDVSSTDVGTPWVEYRKARRFSNDEALSGLTSLSLPADRDTDPTSGPDIDSVGQIITVTTTLAELYGSLSYYYAAGTPSAGDELRVQLFEASGGNLGQLITTAKVLTATGRVEGSWQPLDWEVTDPTAISRLRSLGRAAVVFTMVSGGSPGSTRLWLDDLSANSCVPAASISGRVSRGGAAASDALVMLVATGASGPTVLASTRTAPDGAYSFVSAPVQPSGVSYRVWFLNQPAAAPRQAGLLGFWAGPIVPQLSEGGLQGNLDFDVADIALESPASYAEVVSSAAAPTALRWGGRTASPGERHQLCLYDPARANPTTQLPAQVCGPLVDPSREERVFSLSPASFAAAPAFGFTYGRSYRWYVIVYASDPQSDPNAQYGYSFGERAITLLGAPTEEHTPPGTPEAGDPAAGVPAADWTLLIYMAADNTIGDPRRAPNLGRPSGQLASLPALAAAHPTLNLVSYVDRYGPGGAQLCTYQAGRDPDCRLRAEVNSADPQTLASFIAYGRTRYPARHTALLIVAPGQAAGQLALDETATGAPAMSLAELESAYQAAGLGGASKLDLVIYQAPLLGSFDTLRVTAPFARYMVASAGLIWQLGPYNELLPLLAGAGKDDPAAAARGAVAAYATTLAAVGGLRASTWAAYDLGRAAALEGAVNTLAADIKAALSSETTTTRPALAAARAAAQSYDSSGNGRLDSLETGGDPLASEEDALLDLRDLAAKLELAVGAPAYMQQSAGDLASALENPATTPIMTATIRSGQSTGGNQLDLSRASGLAIFMPSGDRLGGQTTLAESYLFEAAGEPPGEGPWAEMLRAYLVGVLGTGPGGVTEGAGGGAQFRPLPGGFVSTTLYLPVLRR